MKSDLRKVSDLSVPCGADLTYFGPKSDMPTAVSLQRTELVPQESRPLVEEVKSIISDVLTEN